MSTTLYDLVRLLPEWQLGVMRFNDAVADRMGIASSDLQCLFALDRSGPSTPGALANSVGLTTGSASRMIDRLLAAELVTREPDPADRRRVIVSIQPSASARLHAHYDPLDNDLRDLLKRMDEKTLRRLHQFIEDATRVTAERVPR